MRRGLFIPVSSPVATFEQSENVAIAHLVGAACFAKGCGLCNRFHLRMRTVLMGNLAQAGHCLCMNYVSMFCEHVLLTDDHAYQPHYPMIVTLNILVSNNMYKY